MLESSVFMLMKKINDGILAQMNQDLKAWDLTFAQVQVLRFLHHNGGEAMQKDIEKDFQISHPTTVGLVTRLEKNGFVETRTDTRDRRNKIVALTPKAATHFKVSQNDRQMHDAIFLAGLSEEDQKRLRQYLLTIQDNIQKYSGSARGNPDAKSDHFIHNQFENKKGA